MVWSAHSSASRVDEYSEMCCACPKKDIIKNITEIQRWRSILFLVVIILVLDSFTIIIIQ
jgi:hypothetical protein